MARCHLDAGRFLRSAATEFRVALSAADRFTRGLARLLNAARDAARPFFDAAAAPGADNKRSAPAVSRFLASLVGTALEGGANSGSNSPPPPLSELSLPPATDLRAYGELLSPQGDAVRLIAVDPGDRKIVSALSLTCPFVPGDARFANKPRSMGGWLRGRTWQQDTRGLQDARGLRKEQRWREARIRNAPEGARAAVALIPPGATSADLAAFTTYARGAAGAFDASRALHDSAAHRQRRMRTRRRDVRGFHLLIQMLAHGYHTLKTKWHPQPPPPPSRPHKPKYTFLGFGDQARNSQGCISHTGWKAPVGKLVKLIDQWAPHNYPGLILIDIDEFRTSKVCTLCWLFGKKKSVSVRRSAFDPTLSPQYPLQACQGCEVEPGLVVDRDLSAVCALGALLVNALFLSAPPGKLWNFARGASRMGRRAAA